MAEHLGRQPRWPRRLWWGIVLSIVFGAISVVSDLGGITMRLGVLLAVGGVVLTLLIDHYLRQEEIASEQTARQANIMAAQTGFTSALQAITAFANASTSCRTFLGEIADDWLRVEQRGSVFQGWILEDHEHDFRARLRELAAGRATVDRQGRHSFRSMSMKDFVRIRSLSATNIGYWNTPRGRQYAENQRVEIEAHRLTVSRMLVLARDEVDFAADIIRRQVAAGIDVSIIIREEVIPEDDQERLVDQALVTDRAGVTGVLRPGSLGQPETFTTDEDHVAATEYVLEALSPYRRPVRDLYPDLPTPSPVRLATS